MRMQRGRVPKVAGQSSVSKEATQAKESNDFLPSGPRYPPPMHMHCECHAALQYVLCRSVLMQHAAGCLPDAKYTYMGMQGQCLTAPCVGIRQLCKMRT